jgi:Nucleotide modification associated domain 1
MNSLQKDLEALKPMDSSLVGICETMGIKTDAGKVVVRFVLANALLFDRKQLDYGPKNISTFGSFGVVVRMNDKMERLKSLYTIKGRKRRAINESIVDSFRDISNYGIIASMLELGQWPEV